MRQPQSLLDGFKISLTLCESHHRSVDLCRMDHWLNFSSLGLFLLWSNLVWIKESLCSKYPFLSLRLLQRLYNRCYLVSMSVKQQLTALVAGISSPLLSSRTHHDETVLDRTANLKLDTRLASLGLNSRRKHIRLMPWSRYLGTSMEYSHNRRLSLTVLWCANAGYMLS